MATLEIGPGLERLLTITVLAAPSMLAAYYAYRASTQSRKAVGDIAAVHKEVNSTAAELRRVAEHREKDNMEMARELGRSESKESQLLK